MQHATVPDYLFHKKELVWLKSLKGMSKKKKKADEYRALGSETGLQSEKMICHFSRKLQQKIKS
jgi:hypothetical protein